MRPTSSMASFKTGLGLLILASPVANTRPSGPCRAVFVNSSWVTPPCLYSARTPSTMPCGATMLCRKDHMRSNIRESATIDAKISGQIGQPAAWMIDHTLVSRPVGIYHKGEDRIGAAEPCSKQGF